MRKRPNDVEKLDRISATMDADKNGNITVGKDVKVDGKLKLTSLVSASNPDGDITKELGGGGGGGEGAKLYCHNIEFLKYKVGFICFNYYSTRSTPYNFDSLHASWHAQMACTGLIDPENNKTALFINILNSEIFTVGSISKSNAISNANLDKTFEMRDRVSPVD